jgi:phosphoserine phosphatase RsbU/P
VWWLDLALITIVCLIFLLLGSRSGRIWRARMSLLERQRDRVETEERRVFDFLHKLGEALSVDSRAEDLHRFIVMGAIEITEAHGGALYLPDRRGTSVRRAFGVGECATVFAVPPEAAKSRELLETFLRWHSVPVGDDLIGSALQMSEPRLIEGTDPSLPSGVCGSLMIVPLLFAGHRLGVLYIARRSGTEPFLPSSLALFKSVAEHSAFSLYSAAIFHDAAEKRRLDEDLAVAHEIQRILLPTSAPEIPGYQISGINIPAKQVSGDYYDYVTVLPGYCGVAIADVSGKGVPASLIMAMCRSVLRAQAAGELSPSRALKAVNAQLFPDIKEDMFISMAYAVLQENNPSITLCRAGHDAPLLFRAKDRSVAKINPPGMAVGIDSGKVFDRVTNDFSLTLENGDCLIFYTDGITEALDAAGDEFGLDRTITSILASADDGAAAIIARLTDDVRAFIGPHPQNDDITLIAIRKK